MTWLVFFALEDRFGIRFPYKENSMRGTRLFIILFQLAHTLKCAHYITTVVSFLHEDGFTNYLNYISFIYNVLTNSIVLINK